MFEKLFAAFLLGILEGLTEFLPVSSTGHLIIASHLADIQLTENGVFEVAIQSGAICAALTLFKGRIASALTFDNTYFTRNRWIALLFCAFVPTAVIGLLAYDFIKETLFSETVVAVALIAGGFVMLAAEALLRKRAPVCSDIDSLTYGKAIMIGFFQSIAVIPGSSRSACTIIGAMFLGCDRRTAAEFSFLLALPTMFAATAFDLYKHRHGLNADALAIIATGFISAYITAFLTMGALLRYVKKHDFTPFALYRILLGAALLFFLAR